MEEPYVVLRTPIRTTAERKAVDTAASAFRRASGYQRHARVVFDRQKRGGSILDCARKAFTHEECDAVRAMLKAAPDASQATRRKVEKLLTEVGL